MDVIIAFIFLFGLFIIGGVALFINSEFDAAWQNATEVPDESKDFTTSYYSTVENIMDYAIVTFFIILWIVSVVTAFFLDTNPVYFIIYCILGIVSVIGVSGFSLFIAPLQASALGPSLALMPATTFILQQGLWFSAAYVISVAAALYLRPRQEEL